jgi:hexosaminidase
MKIILAFLMIVLVSSLLIAQTSDLNIIPQPNSVEMGNGRFVISKETRIVAKDKETRRSAEALNSLLQSYLGEQLKVTSKTPKDNYIEMMLPGVMAEGEMPRGAMMYALAVEPTRVRIQGFEPARFYAIQTIAQMLPSERTTSISIPVARIVDGPRFAYRGMHLDVGRHFMPVEFLKKYIDLMAQYKFNYFHWHLTEDQGWRIEIKKYPKLTEIGSKRPETVLEHNLQPYVGDKTPVEGFYTQDQIKDVVRYAKDRYITVIPEIEIPGHSSAALAAYPEFGCKQDYQYKVQTTWGIFKEVYCPTEKTFQFLEDVLSEVIDMFPDSPYIHIGGDEVLKDMWKDSPEVQELMKRDNLKDLNEVQSYIIRRIEKFINSKGKKVIGWDEILEGGLAPNATVMSWRGTRGGIEAARAKHDVIMSPTAFAYLNFGQGDPAYEPISYPDYIPLERVYSFDPVPKELSPDEAKYIIGGQGNLWSEYIKTPAAAEYQLFPRMLALSEVLWTRPENKDYADFLRRLAAQFPRLDKQNVNYRIPEPLGLRNQIVGSDGRVSIDISPFIPGSKIYYTLDGSTPTTNSALYTSPVTQMLKDGEVKTLKTITVLPNGRTSSVYAATLVRRDPLPPVDGPAGDKKQGVTWEFFVPSEPMSGEGTTTTGESRSLSLTQFEKSNDLKKPFVVTFDGYLNVPADGIYEFQADSTWDTTIVIDGQMVINDSGTKDRKVRSAVVPLKAGLHKISLRYNHRGGDAGFRILWGLKGQGLNRLYGGEFVH